MAAAASTIALTAAAPAGASLKQDLQRFSDCPYTNPVVITCVDSTTTSGEFVIGKSTVPINQTVVIQGGLRAFGFLVPASDGNTLSKTALQVPGGLVGIELPGNFTEVTATAELAGQAQISTGAGGIALPLKVKLDNLLLGGGCYVGSEGEPVSLHLIYSTTNPPPPNKPIKGSIVVSTKDGGNILVLTGTLVDNAFAAPGANGCTLLPPVGDLAVNIKVGLPAAAGTNTAIMSGATEEANARVVKAILPLPDLGRCLKVEPNAEGKKLVYHGGYTNSSCTLESESKEGKYEWSPGPGPSAKFKGASAGVKLETVGKKAVTCTASTSEGEYTGPKTQKVSMVLTGCFQGPKTQNVACQSSAAAAGEIRTASLVGGMEFIKEGEGTETPSVGVDLKPASGSTVATFECGGKAVSVGGSVIVPVTALDHMVTSFKLKALQAGGKQSPEEFEVGPKDTLTFNEGGEEQAGLAGTLTNTNEELLEIKAIQ
ncbi:MAG TPA: hypothetical protein VNZ01_11975 [Solirubrobacteraceae bacterium]|nr:hypothetical protein [Solirubrobacteraceae bacterium]